MTSLTERFGCADRQSQRAPVARSAGSVAVAGVPLEGAARYKPARGSGKGAGDGLCHCGSAIQKRHDDAFWPVLAEVMPNGLMGSRARRAFGFARYERSARGGARDNLRLIPKWP